MILQLAPDCLLRMVQPLRKLGRPKVVITEALYETPPSRAAA